MEIRTFNMLCNIVSFFIKNATVPKPAEAIEILVSKFEPPKNACIRVSKLHIHVTKMDENNYSL